MKIALGNVELGKVCSCLFVVCLFFLIIVIVREAHLFKIILFQCLSRQHFKSFFFFRIQGHTFENKYFRGIMVLSRVVLYKLTVTKVKIHFKMCYSFLSYRKLSF